VVAVLLKGSFTPHARFNPAASDPASSIVARKGPLSFFLSHRRFRAQSISQFLENTVMSALSDFFTLPVILGVIALAVFLIGLGSLINIAMKKEGTIDKDGRTIAM
jgi:hypothetical protein